MKKMKKMKMKSPMKKASKEAKGFTQRLLFHIRAL